MLCNIAILWWLPPEEIGLWQSLLLIGMYTTILEGGALSGLDRELPFSVGRKELKRSSEMAGTAQTVALVASFVCVVSIPIVFLVSSHADERLGASAVLVGAATLIYRRYLGATYKAAQKFDRLADFQVVEAILAVVTLPLVGKWGFSGLAVRYAGSALFVTALTNHFRPMRSVGRFSWDCLKELAVVGVPLYVSTYIKGVARSLPRLVMLFAGGIHWVGLFAPASALLTGFSMLPGSLAVYFYPRMSHRLGETGDPRSLWPTVVRVTLLNLVVAVPSVAGAFLLLPAMIRRFFPDYVASIPSVVIISFAAFFVSSGITGNALHSLKAWKWIFITGFARLALFGGLPFLGAKVFGTLEGITAGVTVAFAGEFVVTLLAVHVATRQQPAKASP